MNLSLVIRVFLIPIGFIFKLLILAKDGSRDIHNKIRFRGSIIDIGCCINDKSKISQNTHLLNDCIINNSQIDSFTYVGNKCLIQNAKIGKFCSIANEVLIGLGKHPIEHFSTSPLFYRINNPLKIKLIESNSDFNEYLPIDIGNDVWIGTRAIIMDGVTIGNGAIIAANSVVTKDVLPYAIVGGIPAKIIKYRFNSNKIEILQSLHWWKWDLRKIESNFELLNDIK